ncbi:MAG: alpha/beta hydrolase [Acidobacteria bacterium]|nr:alpha/beta hydrolase [Acidobacteriota bacterium]
MNLAGPAGPLEALLDGPGRHDAADDDRPAPRAAAVLAHPHPLQGGTMHTKAVFQAAKGLRRIGCAVLRFNFRGVGQSGGAFDEGRGEREDFSAALTFMADRYPGTPLWAGGFSFGSWVAMETGARDPRVSALIGIAPPVTKPGYSFDATLETTKPKFLVQGSLDAVCPVKDLWAFYARLHEPKELVIIDGASHLFEGKTVEVGEALEDLLGDFD